MAKETSRGAWRVYAGGVLLLVVAAVAVVWLWRSESDGLISARSARAAELERGPRVEVVTAQQGPSERLVKFLGDARPYLSTTLYGKVSGYLKSVPVDRGDQVKAGQVVAEIDSAETDSQYLSAQADLDNKRRIADRNRTLLMRGDVAIQSADQAQTDFRMSEANVRQLGTLKSYEVIRAPFDGTVTARFADPGALIQNATTNQSSSLPVLTIADTSRLRIGIFVEQSDVPFVKLGGKADVVDAAAPDRHVSATITRTAGELDPKSRTLYTEIDIDNRQNLLTAGSFVYVTLHLPIRSYPQVPVSALVTRGDKTFVALLDKDEIHFRAVKIAGTDGIVMNIAEGIVPGDRVAINLPGEVADGDRIQPIRIAAQTR